ncbi:hypothetical protein [Litoreibacter ponti]|uniref:hypothetical protein n=1 Tax=Litoreibacter ponti TaxID=1510457 RepID=UPI0013049C5E|nr:hypothetical protein [Litoreibacter ponti]
MTLGYGDPARLEKLKTELMTWELYQVTIDKYHVMLWFEGGNCLLNVSYRFEFVGKAEDQDYVYDVQASGNRKLLTVEPILRQRIKSVSAPDDRRLVLEFDGGSLIIHDSPKMRSAWFYRYDPRDPKGALLWSEDDEEGEDDL